jgi:hypothetical protein
MRNELEDLAKPKSQAIPCILAEGDVVQSNGPVAMKIVKYGSTGRVAVKIVGDFKVQRNLKVRRK